MSRSPFQLLAFMLTLGLPLIARADCMGPYPPSMVSAFDRNCAQDPQMLPFCSCIMDSVQMSIPLADFIEIGNSAGGINNDPRFIKASKDCAMKLPGAPPAATKPTAATTVPTAQKPSAVLNPAATQTPATGGQTTR